MSSNRLRRPLLSGDSAFASDSHVPSFRVYNGVAFSWESQPGVAKVAPASATDALPPLTPPPSYYCANGAKDAAVAAGRRKKKTSKLKQLASMLLDLTLLKRKKDQRRISPRSPTSSAVSAASPSSVYYSGGWRYDDDDDDDHLDEGSTRPSASCFGVRRVPCMPFYYDRKDKLITRSTMK